MAIEITEIKEDKVLDEVIDVSAGSLKKELSEDLLIEDELEVPPEQLRPETHIRDIKGFIEVLDAIPTHIPKDFYDQIKIVGTTLYIYNYVTQAWVTV